MMIYDENEILIHYIPTNTSIVILLGVKCIYLVIMEASAKDEIISDFTAVIDQIGKKPSDEIESNLQKIVYRVRPYIHKVT